MLSDSSQSDSGSSTYTVTEDNQDTLERQEYEIEVQQSQQQQQAQVQFTVSDMEAFLNQTLNTSEIQISNGVGNSEILNRLDTVEGKVVTLARENDSLKKEVKRLQDDLYGVWDRMYDTERDLQKFQQYSRRENIEIIGIPESVGNHELENTVLDILRRIGVRGISSYEIVGCHRLKKTKRNSPANVIVRFTHRRRAYQSLENRRYLKTNIQEYRNIFIIENLCPKYKEIYDECLRLKQAGKIKRVWSYNGIVHYKTSDNANERGKKIFHFDDLQEQFPDEFE